MQCKDHGYRLGTAGYANVKYGGKSIGRHVMALIEATGEQPNGRFALHSCDNPRCIEPKHLRWGSPADNMRDKQERGRCNNGAKPLLPSVDKLKVMRQDGMTLQQIASQYGVTRQAVSKSLKAG